MDGDGCAQNRSVEGLDSSDFCSCAVKCCCCCFLEGGGHTFSYICWMRNGMLSCWFNLLFWTAHTTWIWMHLVMLLTSITSPQNLLVSKIVYKFNLDMSGMVQIWYEVKATVFHFTRRHVPFHELACRRVKWNNVAFTEWSYLYHHTNKSQIIFVSYNSCIFSGHLIHTITVHMLV